MVGGSSKRPRRPPATARGDTAHTRRVPEARRGAGQPGHAPTWIPSEGFSDVGLPKRTDGGVGARGGRSASRRGSVAPQCLSRPRACRPTFGRGGRSRRRRRSWRWRWRSSWSYPGTTPLRHQLRSGSRQRHIFGLADPGVDDDDELAHDGDGDKRLYAVCNEAVLEGCEVCVVPSGGHEQDVCDFWPATAGMAVAAVLGGRVHEVLQAGLWQLFHQTFARLMSAVR